MSSILFRAMAFVFTILFGYFLKKIQLLKQEDFRVLSTIVVKYTLPCAIIVNLNGSELDPSLLLLIVLGLLINVPFMIAGFLFFRRKGRAMQGFGVLNISGCNIGNFALPFIQSFLGPTGVVVASLFDAGNSFICLGGAYSIGSIVKSNDGSLTFVGAVKRIGGKLMRSVPFVCYVIMTILKILRLSLPAPVISIAQLGANANPFLGMLMVGVGFHLGNVGEQLKLILRYLSVRFAIAIAFSYCMFNFLPLPLEVRQALALVILAPIASLAPAFTREMNEDYGLASAINSMSIVCSVCALVVALMLVL